MSVVFSASTLWNALNARLWFGTRIAPRVVLGGAFGLAGLALLFQPELAGQAASHETLLYLAIFGSVVAFTAYLTLVGRIGPARTAYCTVLFPVVALSISSVAEGYRWTPYAVAGLALVILGNVLVFARRKREDGRGTRKGGMDNAS